MSGLQTLEHVAVTVSLTHPRRGSLELKLFCPSGMMSLIGAPRSLDSYVRLPCLLRALCSRASSGERELDAGPGLGRRGAAGASSGSHSAGPGALPGAGTALACALRP